MTVFAELTLPYPPPLAACFKPSRKRGMVKTQRYNAWIQYAAACTIGQRHMVPGRISVSIQATPQDRRRRDLDNLLKPVLDFCTHRVIEDDSLIDALRISWHRHGEPGVRVMVISMPDEAEVEAA